MLFRAAVFNTLIVIIHSKNFKTAYHKLPLLAMLCVITLLGIKNIFFSFTIFRCKNPNILVEGKKKCLL